MSKYPYMFCLNTKRPICSKVGCRNEATWFTWLSASGGSRVVSGWNTCVTACNVHVKEYSDALSKDIGSWVQAFNSTQKGGETDGKTVE